MAKKEKKIKTQTYEQFEKKNVIPDAVDVNARTVRVKALRAFEIAEGKGFKIINGGQEALLTEAEAKEFCDRKFTGYMPFYGYMPDLADILTEGPNPLARKEIVRAIRI